MKRSIAFLLALVLIFTPALHAFASEPDLETGENIAGSSDSSISEPDAVQKQEEEKAVQQEKKTQEAEIPEEPDTVSEEEELKAETSEEEIKGQVNVTVRSAVLLEKSVEFTIR